MMDRVYMLNNACSNLDIKSFNYLKQVSPNTVYIYPETFPPFVRYLRWVHLFLGTMSTLKVYSDTQLRNVPDTRSVFERTSDKTSAWMYSALDHYTTWRFIIIIMIIINKFYFKNTLQE